VEPCNSQENKSDESTVQQYIHNKIKEDVKEKRESMHKIYESVSIIEDLQSVA